MTDEQDDVSTDLPEESISTDVGERVRSVISAAESAATAIRHEADRQALIIRRAAEVEAGRTIDQARREADELLAARVRRISELSDAILEGAESLLMQLEGAQEVKRQLASVVGALASAAGQLAAERGVEPPAVPAAAPVEPAEAEAAPVGRAAAAEAAKPKPGAGDGDAQAARAEPAAAAPAKAPAPAQAKQPEPEAAPADPVPAKGADNGAPSDGPQVAAVEGDELLSARLVALQMAVAGSSREEVETHLKKVFELSDPGAVLNDVFGEDSPAS